MRDGGGHPRLAVCGYSEAGMFLRGKRRAEVTAVISICGRREFRVEADVPHRLDLCFDDVDAPAPAPGAGAGGSEGDDDVAPLRAHARRRWAEQNALVEVPPAAEDVAAIIASESVRSTAGVVLCHCGAGMSRAPAAALICLAVWTGPGQETACVDHLRALRPGAVPHRGLVRLADQLLGRRGDLLGALVRQSVD